MKAQSRYDKSKTPELKEYEFLTLSELKNNLSSHVLILDKNNRVARVLVTSIKTWKTRPDVKIGWKFGLYEYGSELITSDSDNQFFVKEVQP